MADLVPLAARRQKSLISGISVRAVLRCEGSAASALSPQTWEKITVSKNSSALLPQLRLQVFFFSTHFHQALTLCLEASGCGGSAHGRSPHSGTLTRLPFCPFDCVYPATPPSPSSYPIPLSGDRQANLLRGHFHRMSRLNCDPVTPGLAQICHMTYSGK